MDPEIWDDPWDSKGPLAPDNVSPRIDQLDLSNRLTDLRETKLTK
jgi:hypothetical protein